MPDTLLSFALSLLKSVVPRLPSLNHENPEAALLRVAVLGPI